MTITHDNFVFTHLAGILQATPWDAPTLAAQRPGLIGVTHLLDESKQRRLACRYTLDGFASEAALLVELEEIGGLINRLTGTVTVDPGGGAPVMQYADCTFAGYIERDRFLDGSGVNGWVSRGQLRWIQRTRN